MDAVERGVPAPQVEIMEHRAARREVFRERSTIRGNWNY